MNEIKIEMMIQEKLKTSQETRKCSWAKNEMGYKIYS